MRMLLIEPKVLMAMVTEKTSPINRENKTVKTRKMQHCNQKVKTEKAD